MEEKTVRILLTSTQKKMLKGWVGGQLRKAYGK
jgi:hypothetical protein